MKNFCPGIKYKKIVGLKNIFDYFGKEKPLSDVQILYIVQRCYSLGWSENKTAKIDDLMDLHLDKI